MTMVLTPEIGVPYCPNVPYMDLRDRAVAACATAKMLGTYGLDIIPSFDDIDTAQDLLMQHATDPHAAAKAMTTAVAAKIRPASLIEANRLLTEFGQGVVQSAIQIRHLVTNKLILETDSPDARVRLKSLELLGKISDVGLFVEKTEMTVTHQSAEQLREKLREKLAKLIHAAPEVPEGSVLLESSAEAVAFDVDQELGLGDKE